MLLCCFASKYSVPSQQVREGNGSHEGCRERPSKLRQDLVEFRGQDRPEGQVWLHCPDGGRGKGASQLRQGSAALQIKASIRDTFSSTSAAAFLTEACTAKSIRIFNT